MRQVLLVLAGLAWFGFLFVVTFFLTFPNDAVVERARWEVSERSNGQYSLELGDLGPWWLGAAASDVKLFNVPRAGDPSLALLADDLRVKFNLISLVSGTPQASGSITPINGTLYYTVGTARGKKGDLKVNAAKVTASAFPIMELLLLSGTDAAGSGGLDIDVDVAGEASLKGSSGHVRINGKGLVLSDLEIPGVGPLGMDVPLDDIDIDIKLDDGRAEIKKGEIVSSLLKADLSGDMSMAANMERSTMNVVIVLSDLGPDLQSFAPMLAQAEVSPGSETYQFTCSGTVGRPKCEMGSGRSSSRRSRAERRTPTRSPRGRTGRSDDDVVRPTRERPDADELRRKREERLERLRKLREERAAEVQDREDDEEFYDEDEPLDEEEPFDDELDEEFLDEEEFLDDDEFYEE